MEDIGFLVVLHPAWSLSVHTLLNFTTSSPVSCLSPASLSAVWRMPGVAMGLLFGSRPSCAITMSVCRGSASHSIRSTAPPVHAGAPPQDPVQHDDLANTSFFGTRPEDAAVLHDQVLAQLLLEALGIGTTTRYREVVSVPPDHQRVLLVLQDPV